MIFFGVLVGIAIGWFVRDLDFQQKYKDASQNQLDAQSKIEITQALTPLEEPSQVVLSRKLLSNPQIDKLIALFKLEMDISDQEQLDFQLIEYAKRLVSEPKKFKRIESQLVTLSNIDSVKLKVLPLLISYYQKINRNKSAIIKLYELRNLTSFDVDFKQITQKIHQLTTKQIKHYEHRNQKEDLIQFYEDVIAIEPDNYALQMKFAKFEYDNRHYENANRLLSILIYHPFLEEQALTLLQKTQFQLSRQGFKDLPINVDNINGQYIVTAIINDLEPVRLMLDTGATLTVLSPEVINSLGIYDDQKNMRFSTANGHVNAASVLIDKIDIQNYIASDIEVGVLPSFPMGNIDGLLGMNFLSQFSFFIDQENQILHLSHIEEE